MSAYSITCICAGDWLLVTYIELIEEMQAFGVYGKSTQRSDEERWARRATSAVSVTRCGNAPLCSVSMLCIISISSSYEKANAYE